MPLTDTVLIAAAIAAAGLDPNVPTERARFAALIGRDDRTVKNWLDEGNRIPPAARAWLEQWLTLPDRRRRSAVRAFTERS